MSDDYDYVAGAAYWDGEIKRLSAEIHRIDTKMARSARRWRKFNFAWSFVLGVIFAWDLTGYFLSGEPLYLLGALLMVALLVFHLTVTIPRNNKMLARAEARLTHPET